MRPAPFSESFCQGDVCLWFPKFARVTSRIGILLQKTKSLKTGNYWKILLEDNTIVLAREIDLEKVVN
jgi:hypothetical protein